MYTMYSITVLTLINVSFFAQSMHNVAHCCLFWLMNWVNVIVSIYITETYQFIFTAATEDEVKYNIMDEFTQPNGLLQFVVATIPFRMGLDAPNIRRVVHWGLPHNIEAYVQESGRCGRDGKSAFADLYFTGKDFSGHSSAIKRNTA